MRVRVSRIDQSLPLPVPSTDGAAAIDLFARVDTPIAGGGIGMVPSNIIVRVPPGHVLLVTLRSSTPRRLGLIAPHGIGVIDEDYCGPEDEVKVLVLNIRDEPVTVHRGDRIAQAFLLSRVPIEWDEAEPEQQESRGGFGSTG